MKKILLYSLLALCSIVLSFKIFLYCANISLSKISDRNATYVLPKELKQRIDKEADFRGRGTSGLLSPSLYKQAIDYSLDLTAELLRFSEHNNIENGKANCVGYAKVCAAIYNYVCRINHIDSSAKPVVGIVRLNDINLCDVVVKVLPKYKYFFKDHDFVEVKIPEHRAYYDPSAYDVVGEDFRTIENK